MDAQSLICFMKDIIELYCNRVYEGIPYPKEMSSYIEQLKKDLAYEAGSKAQQKDAAFFEKLIASSEPIYNGPARVRKTGAGQKGNRKSESAGPPGTFPIPWTPPWISSTWRKSPQSG